MRFLLSILVLAGASAFAEASTHQVMIEAMKFNPAEIRIKSGDTVVWINKDIVPHTATANKKFDSGTILSERSYKAIVKGHGEILYTCTFHPTMLGKIIIEN